MSKFPQQTKESGQQPLTAANLQALEPTLTGQHEVLGRFVGGSNSLIDRAELQAIFRANDLLGDAANAQFFNALLEQHAAADPANPAKLAGSSIRPLIGNVDHVHAAPCSVCCAMIWNHAFEVHLVGVKCQSHSPAKLLQQDLVISLQIQITKVALEGFPANLTTLLHPSMTASG